MELQSDAPLTVDESNFERLVLGSDKPVLLDFQADWCSPCHAIAPVIETFAMDYEGRLTVGTVDVDANPALAARYGVRSVPTVLLLAEGDVQRAFVGARAPQEYREGIDSLVQ